MNYNFSAGPPQAGILITCEGTPDLDITGGLW